MLLHNNIAGNFEEEYFKEIHYYLNQHLDNEITLITRVHSDIECLKNIDRKFITFVTSAEGHRYIPEEIFNENCLACFTQYYPKFENYYDRSAFDRKNKLFELPLGTGSGFTGNSNIPILDRRYGYTFLGQLDFSARQDLHMSLTLNDSYPCKKFIYLYEGWNQGIPMNQYSEIMSDTKIALVPRGSASLDSFRFYEAIKCGCIVLTTSQNEYGFMRGSPHIEMKTWANLNIYLDNIFSDDEKMINLSKSASVFWENNLSPLAISKYILSKINRG